MTFYQSVPFEERASIGQGLMSTSFRKSTISPQSLKRTVSVVMPEITGKLFINGRIYEVACKGHKPY